MRSYLRKLNTILTRIAEAITVLALAVIAIVIPYEVLGRYVLADMPAWSGETATFSLVWLSMMGSAVGFRKGYQISLNSLIDRLPPRSARFVVRSSLILLMAFLLVMIYYGTWQTMINWHQLSPALGIPMALPYAALPAGFGLMLLSALEEASDFS
jgi:TRAP-type C4-dicarboxylate transport system permease small subunit